MIVTVSSKESELYEDFVVSHQNDEPQLFAQVELNDLVRKLDLPKCSAELLGPQLKEKHVGSRKQSQLLLLQGKRFN